MGKLSSGGSSVRFTSRWAGTGLLLILLLPFSLAPIHAGPVAAAQDQPGLDGWAAYEDVEAQYEAEEVSLATGDPGAEHAVYDWPFALESIGHAIQSYQYYGGSPYFHHGLDIMAPAGMNVATRSGGQIVNIENYQPGNSLYWEIAVLDPEGYLWQYHHIDEPSIPQYIWDKYYEYLADPINGGFVSPGAFLGEIVWWPVGYPGAPTNFHHIHLNILGEGGVYLNGMEFHTALADPDEPEIYDIGLLVNDQIYPGDEVEGDYSLYVQTRDLLMSDLYWLPPYEVAFSVDGGPLTTVWRFDDLPGGGDRYAYVTDYFVVPPTCGDYGCNDFWIDLGFIPDDHREFPGGPGSHTVDVWSYDFSGNGTTASYTWTVISDYTLHVGDLDGKARIAPTGHWQAFVQVLVHDQDHAPLANATVTGTWSDGKPGTNTCTTNSRGRCVVFQKLHRTMTSVSFTVDNVERTGYAYAPADNHDPDGDSNGTTIILNKP
jgi:hypothetical protein